MRLLHSSYLLDYIKVIWAVRIFPGKLLTISHIAESPSIQYIIPDNSSEKLECSIMASCKESLSGSATLDSKWWGGVVVMMKPSVILI